MTTDDDKAPKSRIVTVMFLVTLTPSPLATKTEWGGGAGEAAVLLFKGTD